MNADDQARPSNADGEDSLDVELGQVFDAYLAQLEAGRKPDPERLLAENPAIADKLRAFLDVMRVAGSFPGSPQPTSCHTIGTGRITSSLLTTLWTGPGDPPRVLLRDPPSESPPLAFPGRDGANAMDETPSGRYRLLGEIARGGMGAIHKGYDADLGRELAFKVLLEKHQHDPEIVWRFLEEAQIGGQLQHPGIVPVYDLGTFADRQPYFAMKLIKGRTLSALLSERASPATDLPRFLGIFQQVCQTVAYAHARGVIHRDLKPSNVMVGSFGEVQVMDWGLAKVLSTGGVADDARAGREVAHETVIATARSESDSDRSQVGSVLGTPSYMAPEQARGELDAIDERADVFALGSILCEIISGKPALIGRTTGEIQRKAARGDVTDAHARLAASGSDAELIALAENCLAAEAADRPRDAGVVAAKVSAHLAGVQERLRRAELHRVEAQARAEELGKQRELADALAREAEGRAAASHRAAAEERKRRRATLALAASVLALVVLGGGGAFWQWQLRQTRLTGIARSLAAVEALRDSARGNAADSSGWRVALAAAEQAVRSSSELTATAQGRRLAAIRAELAAAVTQAERDRTLLADLTETRSSLTDLTATGVDTGYAAAFIKYGLDVDATPTDQAAARLKQRPVAVIAEVVNMLDAWASVRRDLKLDATKVRALLNLATSLDTDDYRNQIRAMLLERDLSAHRNRLRALARDRRAAELSPQSALVLAGALKRAWETVAAISVMRAAASKHPGDVWVNYGLAGLLAKADPPQPDDAIRFYSIARSLRPETAHELGHMLSQHGRREEAEAVFRDLTMRRPDSEAHLMCYRSISAGHLGPEETTRLDERIRAIQKTGARQHPRQQEVHPSIVTGPEEARVTEQRETLIKKIAAAREAARLKSNDLEAQLGLGRFLLRLERHGWYDEAIAAFRAALRLKPDDPQAHHDLAEALLWRGRVEESEAEYREAVRLRPEFFGHHAGLGLTLEQQFKWDEAIAQYREVLRLKPDSSSVRLNIDIMLNAQGNHEQAISEFRASIRAEPFNVGSSGELALMLVRQGDHPGAIAEILRANDALLQRPGNSARAAQRLEEIQRLTGLADRLPLMLRGMDEPRDIPERLTLAELCHNSSYYVAATRFWAVALESDPSVSGDRRYPHRYNAACSASLAAAGKGRDESPPDDAKKAGLRGQALNWLKAELDTWAEQLEPSRFNHAWVSQKLQLWNHDPDLASVRDPDGLAKLPEPERTEWRALWADFDSLLAKARSPQPSPAR